MFNQLDVWKHYNAINKHNQLAMIDEIGAFAALPDDERKTLGRRRDKREKLFFSDNGVRYWCEDPSFNAEICEQSLERRRSINEPYKAALEVSGLNYGVALDCETSRYTFVGGTGKIQFWRAGSVYDRKYIFQGQYLIRDTGEVWRLEYLNDVGVNLEFADFGEAVKTVLEHYRNIGAIPLGKGIAALRPAGIWEAHTIDETTHRIKLIGGTNHQQVENDLQVEHEFAVVQHETQYVLEKLDDLPTHQSFESLDDALEAVLAQYQEKNLTEEVYHDSLQSGIPDPLPESATANTPPITKGFLARVNPKSRETTSSTSPVGQSLKP